MTKHRTPAPRRRSALGELAHLDRADLTTDERLTRAEQIGAEEADRIAERITAVVVRIAEHEVTPFALTVARLGSYPGALAVLNSVPEGLRAAADEFDRNAAATKATIKAITRDSNTSR